ncbi:MAG: tRNA 2-selenouridine(34) synthase MnmH [Haliscomenobacter sp.]
MRKLPICEFLESEWRKYPLLDVRSPGEFEAGHIPGAFNLPLFSDEERAIVGTLYKQKGPETAFQKGLELAGKKLPWYVEEARHLAAGSKEIVVHCWRGGQRSGSLAWLLGFAGFDVSVLEGGYKAYRRYVHAQFEERPFRGVVLGGATGSGKTAVLKTLREIGEQVLDLEGLAHHKGSAFGALGETPQPGVEQFENNLFDAFQALDTHRRVWVENESRAIGRVHLPEELWHRLQKSPLIHLEVPFENRVSYLVEVYGTFPREGLEASFLRIERKLGGQHLKTALQALESGDYATAAAIALKYYDKTYAYTTSKGDFDPIIDLYDSSKDHKQTALRLKELADEHGL